MSFSPPRTFRALIALLALLGVADAAQALGQASGCPAMAPTFRNVVEEPSYERGLGIQGIEALPHLHARSNPIERIYGLYTSKLVGTLDMSLDGRMEGSQVAVCFSRFDATLTLNSTIHVAREFPTGSCAERAVSEHEFHHHQIQVSTQQAAVAAFLARNPMPTIPFRGSDVASARALARQWGDAYLQTLSRSAMQFAQPLQQDFDSPSEYRRVNSLCPAEFSRVLLAIPRRAAH